MPRAASHFVCFVPCRTPIRQGESVAAACAMAFLAIGVVAMLVSSTVAKSADHRVNLRSVYTKQLLNFMQLASLAGAAGVNSPNSIVYSNCSRVTLQLLFHCKLWPVCT